jgi:ABC-2 type transport system permease protein
MTTLVADTTHMTTRHVMELIRQPWWILVNLVQPVIWLLLFGALFESVTKIPGFAADSYIEFLAPGVAVMTAFFTAGWSGMGLIEDLHRGVTNRFLVSPVRRSALVLGRLGQSALTIAIQTLIIVVLALAVGAQFANGVGGVLVLVAITVVIGAGFGALSNAMALLARREETLIAAMQFLMLPLSFLSATFMDEDLMPSWMQTVAAFNPVDWAVEAAREALTANPDWVLIATRGGLLAAFFALTLTLAVRAFGSYQRSL